MANQLIDSTNHSLNKADIAAAIKTNGYTEVSLKPTFGDNNLEVDFNTNSHGQLHDAREVMPVDDNDDKIKCSAIHSLERDMPDFDYSHLIDELRDRILKHNEENVGLYSHADIEKCKTDRWFVARFLLRHKLDIDAAFTMLKKALRYKNESLASSIKRQDFPAEFFKASGLFPYEEDRKGNKMLYIRVRVHRKIHEINLVLQSFLQHNINYCDELANGRGECFLVRSHSNYFKCIS